MLKSVSAYLLSAASICGMASGQCVSDVNQDGVLDGFDFGAWLGAFNAGSLLADANLDGVLDGADYGAWSTDFNGCPNKMSNRLANARMQAMQYLFPNQVVASSTGYDAIPNLLPTSSNSAASSGNLIATTENGLQYNVKIRVGVDIPHTAEFGFTQSEINDLASINSITQVYLVELTSSSTTLPLYALAMGSFVLDFQNPNDPLFRFTIFDVYGQGADANIQVIESALLNLPFTSSLSNGAATLTDVRLDTECRDVCGNLITDGVYQAGIVNIEENLLEDTRAAGRRGMLGFIIGGSSVVGGIVLIGKTPFTFGGTTIPGIIVTGGGIAQLGLTGANVSDEIDNLLTVFDLQQNGLCLQLQLRQSSDIACE